MENLWQRLSKMTNGELTSLVALVVGCISMLNEKFRSFVLAKLNFNQTKSKLRNEIMVSETNTLDLATKKINDLYNEFLKLSDDLLILSKENNQLKFENESLKNRLLISEQKLQKYVVNCKNNCSTNV